MVRTMLTYSEKKSVMEYYVCAKPSSCIKSTGINPWALWSDSEPFALCRLMSRAWQNQWSTQSGYEFYCHFWEICSECRKTNGLYSRSPWSVFWMLLGVWLPLCNVVLEPKTVYQPRTAVFLDYTNDGKSDILDSHHEFISATDFILWRQPTISCFSPWNFKRILL